MSMRGTVKYQEESYDKSLVGTKFWSLERCIDCKEQRVDADAVQKRMARPKDLAPFQEEDRNEFSR